jgi:competence protein ComEC
MEKFSREIKIRVAVILVVFFSSFIVLFLQIPDHKFHIYFLDVGQGDSILVKTPQGHQVLIDGGPGNFVIEQLAEVMPFFDKTIDLMVMTHPHDDHIAGLIEVLRRYEVSAVLMTGVIFENQAYAEFLREINLQGIQIFYAQSDSDFLFGDVIMDILYPFKNIAGDSFSNINNSSIAMMLHYKNQRILLTGDLEKEFESELVSSGIDLNADIYKAGHHGSRSSSSEDFLEKISPKTVVIQVGKNNKFAHPHPETLRALYRAGVEKIDQTDLLGRIEFVF